MLIIDGWAGPLEVIQSDRHFVAYIRPYHTVTTQLKDDVFTRIPRIHWFVKTGSKLEDSNRLLTCDTTTHTREQALSWIDGSYKDIGFGWCGYSGALDIHDFFAYKSAGTEREFEAKRNNVQ